MSAASCDVSTLEKSCRLCMSQNGVLSPIFQDVIQHTRFISLPAKIIACVDVEVTKDDKLPHQICHRCLYKVECSYDFKEQCQKTEKLLRKYFLSDSASEKDTPKTSVTPELPLPLVTEIKSEAPVKPELCVDDEEEEEEENYHEMGYTEGEGDDIGDYEDEEMLEGDKALVESLAKCPDLRVVQPPCDSSIKGLSLEVDIPTEAQHRCHLCNNSFPNQQNLWVHLVNHNTDGPPFLCPVCSETFGLRSALEDHWKTHSNETPFSCLLCSSIFPSSEALEEHIKTHRSPSPLSCSDCDETFTSTSDLKKHVLVHAGSRPLKCQICPKEFSRTTNLNKHMRVHSGQRPYSCGECPKMFRTRGDMLRHQIIHTGQKPFSCSVCMLSFNRKDKLTRHERLHLSEKQFSCTFCSMTFLRKDDLSRHSLMHLNAPPSEELEQETATDLRVACRQEQEPLEEDELSLDGEGRLTIVEGDEQSVASGAGAGADAAADAGTVESAVDSAQQSGHVDTSSQVESMVISVDPFHVNSGVQSSPAACDSSTCWPQNLSVDKPKRPRVPQEAAASPQDAGRAPAKPYTCDTCNKKFSDKSYMKTHQLTHFGVRPHACGYCGKAFFRRRELLRHEAVHTGVKPFKCSTCHKAFARSDKLMRHERTHGNVQQHSCPQCPAKFARKDDLTRHGICHSGNKPHSCSMCAKAFFTKGELTRHEKTHAAKGFKCKLCTQVFPRKDMAAHIRTHEAGEQAEMPLIESVDLRGLVTQCTRFGNEVVAVRTVPILSQGSEFHLVIQQN